MSDRDVTLEILKKGRKLIGRGPCFGCFIRDADGEPAERFRVEPGNTFCALGAIYAQEGEYWSDRLSPEMRSACEALRCAALKLGKPGVTTLNDEHPELVPQMFDIAIASLEFTP